MHNSGGSWWLAAGALAAVFTGCSSSSGSSGPVTGVVPCSANATAASDACSLSMPVQGGLSGTLDASGCGALDTNTIYWQSGLSGGAPETAINVVFTTPIPVDQVGTFPATIEIVKIPASGGVGSGWQTPMGACSVTIQGSVCAPTQVFAHRRVLDGSGTCSQPAAPEMGTSGPAVTIGAFEFSGFINPMM